MVSDTETYENEIAASSKAHTYATESEGKETMSIKMNIDKIFSKKDNNTIQASVGLSLTFSVKLYVSFKYSYLELRGDYSTDVSISLNINTNDTPIKEFKLVKMVFPIAPGINITLTPSFVVEAKASITYKGTVGFNFNTKKD